MEEFEKPLYESLGRQLKEARRRLGYSLDEVAEIVGKSKASIKRYEDATAKIDKSTLDKICTALDVEAISYTISIDGEYERKIALTAKSDDSENENITELQEYMAFLKALSDKLLENFMKLDTDQQRIVLMMLKFENVEEVLNRIH